MDFTEHALDGNQVTVDNSMSQFGYLADQASVTHRPHLDDLDSELRTFEQQEVKLWDEYDGDRWRH